MNFQIHFHPATHFRVIPGRPGFNIRVLFPLKDLDPHRKLYSKRAYLLNQKGTIALTLFLDAGALTPWDTTDKAIDIPKKSPNALL
jgi:hypothetical protein